MEDKLSVFYFQVHDGPNREGALFCRSGTWVEILDKRTAEYEAKTNEYSRPEYVRGTRLENSRFNIFGIQLCSDDVVHRHC
ncbi:unnamed protein product [Onchocerca flexuosa]|uniref:Calpain catalytic domain-containing protein n=1 Tax=Onchocerca flexuosa TaxID=387005 RepID=A0A183HRD7_9BILA|nr:unnamed protein product [Onchocerca flexuosa]